MAGLPESLETRRHVETAADAGLPKAPEKTCEARIRETHMADLGHFIVNHWLLFLAFVIILTLLAMNMGRTRLLGFQEVGPADAVQLMNHHGAHVLDTRDGEEFNGGHILKAIHIPVTELEDRIAELEALRSEPIIVYCKTGQRSARACNILKNKGFTGIHKLAGGMLAWQGAHLPVTKDV
jgi:rhodanese-related sulfurtransferase